MGTDARLRVSSSRKHRALPGALRASPCAYPAHGAGCFDDKPPVIIGFCGVVILAIQHVSIKNGARGSGAKHARYVGGEGRYGDRDDVAHIEDGNLPKWAANAVEFFSAADEFEQDKKPKKMKTRDGEEYEKTVRGRVYKEIEAAIPREAKDPVQWAKDFARDLIGDDHPYRLAVHDKAAGGGGRNVHMHLMFSTRTMDSFDREPERFFKRANTGSYKVKGETRYHPPGAGGAKKSDHWNSRECVPDTRKRFELHVQRVAPDFKMKRSAAPEPKMGPVLKNAGKEYNDQREERRADVDQLRSLKMVRDIIDSEIKLERSRERPTPNRVVPDWSKYQKLAIGRRDNELPSIKLGITPPNWSKFRKLAGAPSDNRLHLDEQENEQSEPLNDQDEDLDCP